MRPEYAQDPSSARTITMRMETVIAVYGCETDNPIIQSQHCLELYRLHPLTAHTNTIFLPTVSSCQSLICIAVVQHLPQPKVLHRFSIRISLGPMPSSSMLFNSGLTPQNNLHQNPNENPESSQ